MVGLSVILENQKSGNIISKKTPQVISKTTMLITQTSNTKVSSSTTTATSCFLLSQSTNSQLNNPVPAFLQQCFLCKQRLLPGNDIYMYKGDKGFCSVECRCRQIFMDEEENLKKQNCSLASIKPSTSSSGSPSSGSRHHRKAGRNRAGGFAY